MTTLAQALASAAIDATLPATLWTPQARRLLAAICMQESGGENVPQRLADGTEGLAAGFPQMQANGIEDVLANPASAALAAACVERAGILDSAGAKFSPGPRGYPLGATHPVAVLVRANFLNFPTLQLQLARLMLWDNPHPLPPMDDSDANWAYYLETWRPGKPSRARWDGFAWLQACAIVPTLPPQTPAQANTE